MKSWDWVKIALVVMLTSITLLTSASCIIDEDYSSMSWIIAVYIVFMSIFCVNDDGETN